MAFQLIDASLITGQITTPQIAPGAVTFPKLAAGIVYAGIVNGTLIEGAEFVAGGGNPTGYFAYGGTPRNGNPPVDWAAPAGVTADPFGNTLTAAGGFISQAPGGGGAWCQLVDGTLKMTDTNGNNWELAPFLAAGTPYLAIQAGGNPVSFINQAGGHVAAQPGTAIPETWHNAILNTGFTSAGGQAPVGYQLLPIGAGRVELRGQVQISQAVAQFTTIFTLPAGYRPAFQQFRSGTPNSLSSHAVGSTDIQVTTGGAVQLGVAASNGNYLILDGLTVELD